VRSRVGRLGLGAIVVECEAVVFENGVEILNSPLQLLVGRIGESEPFSEQVSSYRH
jgi:hypothetical protein